MLIILIFQKQYEFAMYLVILFATLIAPKSLSDKQSEIIEKHTIQQERLNLQQNMDD